MKQPVDMSVPTVTVENYAIQDSVVGITPPIGLNTAVPSHFSTWEENSKMGLLLVNCHITGSAAACDDVSVSVSCTPRETAKLKTQKS